MKSFAVLLALLAATPLPGRGDDPKTIGAAQAAAYVGKRVVVTGVVAQVSFRPGLTCLNLDKPYPDSPFTAVIRGSGTNQFDNLPALNGKPVAIKGEVKEFKGKPQIELTAKHQLTVQGGKQNESNPGGATPAAK